MGVEFNMIGSAKLRVLLSEDECRELGIKITDGEYETKRVRDAVRRVVARAGEEVGFVSEGERLLIQLYPAADRACEMLVTKLSVVGERERTVLTEASNLTTYLGRESTFRFPDLDCLISGAACIKCDRPCDLYLSDDGYYYLVLAEHTVDGYSDLDVLSEFGSRVPPSVRRAECEHWRLIRRDVALLMLGGLK